MSSLANALIPPSNLTPALPVSFPLEITESQDVEMLPSDSENVPKIEEEPKEEQDEEMADLFGNDDDVEGVKPDGSVASPEPSGHDSDRLPSAERDARKALEYEEDDRAPDVVEVKEANVDFPNIPVPKSSDGDNWVIRMPNFVKVDSKPYHPDTYMGPEQEDEEALQAETLREKSMSIKLKVENTIRWRWTKDESGQDRRQSNSRIIRWSDGTLSLRLGKELFDINRSIDTSGGVPRQALGGPQVSQIPGSSQSQSQSQSQSLAPGKSQGLTYLVAQHKRAQVLQAEALVTGYMTLRPTGMQSETHQMLVRAVGQKHNKVARLRMAPDPTMDPEREKLELMKQSAKKSKKKADMDDGFGGGRKRRLSRKRAGHDVWSDDDEEGHEFAPSDEEDEEGMGSGASARKNKRKGTEGDAKKGAGDYQEDDFVVADSSDEEGGSEGGVKRKRKHGDDEMEEELLDKLESKLKAQQDAKRRQRPSSDGAETGQSVNPEAEVNGDREDEEMDVESEEEEEEFKVRRVGGTGGSRKRRAIDFEEEEEE